ncbi:MAG: hypothetical protein IID51_03660 [Proteobacteria bacterium]|nr:hypothetical protein [Pseudomonadota bacterium]
MLTPKLSYTGLMTTLPKVTKTAEAQEMRVALSQPTSGRRLIQTLAQQQATLLRKLIKVGTVGYANDPKSRRTLLVEDKTGIRVLGLDGKDIPRPIPVTYKTVAFSLANFVTMLATPEFEDLIRHMYLDSAGNVTIGIGHLIRDAGTAVALHNSGSFTFARLMGGRRATDAEVIADYNTVINAEGSNKKARAFASITALRVVDSEVRALALIAATSRFNKFMQSGRHPDFNTYPIEVQMVIIDMVYNLGQSGFFSKFPNFEKAVKHRDWHTAKAESSRTSEGKPLVARNNATATLLQAAARKSSERYFISTDPKIAKLVKIVTPSGTLMLIKAP